MERSRTSLDSAEVIAGQMLMASLPGPELDAETERLLRAGQGGSVCLFSKNVRSPAQLRSLCDALRAASGAKGADLLVAADLEGGYVWRLTPPSVHPPSAMACGAARRPDLTRQLAASVGEEMRAQGIDLNFAPVVDVNSNPANPVIATRSYGGSPELVAEHAVAAIEGYRQAGVATCAKHFPGHGDTQVDSHLSLPTIDRPMAELERIELPPFVAAIRAGVEMVMTAHVVFPALEPDSPATLSRRILHGLLRERLGFEGVVVTDAMTMQAISDRWGTVEGSVMSAVAGADVITSTGPAAQSAAIHAALVRAIQNGRLPRAQARASAERVLALKQRLLGVARPSLEVVGSPAHQEAAARLAAASITTVRDEARPALKVGQDVAVVELYAGPRTGAEDTRGLHGLLAKRIQERGARVTAVQVDVGDVEAAAQDALAAASSAAALVLATRNAWRSEAQLRFARRLLAAAPHAAVVALRDPYDLATLDAPTLLAAYCDVPATIDAVAAALFGAAASGTLPVPLA